MMGVRDDIVNEILGDFMNTYPYLCVEREDRETFKNLIAKSFRCGYEKAIENYCVGS